MPKRAVKKPIQYIGKYLCETCLAIDVLVFGLKDLFDSVENRASIKIYGFELATLMYYILKIQQNEPYFDNLYLNLEKIFLSGIENETIINKDNTLYYKEIFDEVLSSKKPFDVLELKFNDIWKSDTLVILDKLASEDMIKNKVNEESLSSARGVNIYRLYTVIINLILINKMKLDVKQRKDILKKLLLVFEGPNFAAFLGLEDQNNIYNEKCKENIISGNINTKFNNVIKYVYKSANDIVGCKYKLTNISYSLYKNGVRFRNKYDKLKSILYCMNFDTLKFDYCATLYAYINLMMGVQPSMNKIVGSTYENYYWLLAHASERGIYEDKNKF